MSVPRVLIIEDSYLHRFIAETLFRQAGFTVTTAHSLMLGIEHAYVLLDPTKPALPTLILIDLMLPHERCPILEGTAGIAHLIEQMEAGNLHSAHAVAITGELTDQRRQEALAAGCYDVLAKPFSISDAIKLRQLVDEEPKLPSESDLSLDPTEAMHRCIMRRTLRREAAQLFHFLNDSPRQRGRDSIPETDSEMVTWTATEVRALLVSPAEILRTDPWRSWVRRHGGIEQIRQRIADLHIVTTDQRDLLKKVLENGDNWRLSTEQLKISRAKYYRDRDAAFEAIALILNTWDESLS